jgi:hypothetical protein
MPHCGKVGERIDDARTQQWQEVDGSQDCEACYIWRLSTFLLPKTPFKSLMIQLLAGKYIQIQ